jgi:fused signal recognition particle receptor
MNDAPPPAGEEFKPKGFFGRLRDSLGKTRSSLVDNVKRVITRSAAVDDALFDELEQTLIEADVGVDTTLAIIADLRRQTREQRVTAPEAVLDLLKAELVAMVEPGDHTLRFETSEPPHVTLIAGVNGSGKTTTAGKLAARLKGQGKNVLLGAADTFRAAAAEQLTIWSERTGAPIIRHKEGADPAAVAYDAVDAAVARAVDCVIIDTAGRLHTKTNLMEELKKIQRVVKKRAPEAPHEVLLVLDATTGQNGLQQARIFTEALTVTGIVLTKLDGTAKGGVVIGIQRELGIPIKLIGIGEKVDDLQPFEPAEFIQAMFG